MNTAIFSALLEYPSVFFLKFLVEPLAGAAVAYGLVWIAMRPKDGRRIRNSALWHSCGVAATVIGSAAFRILAMVTFAGRSAYEPASATGAAGFYILIIPAIIAVGYIAWLKTKHLKVVPAASVGSPPANELTLKAAAHFPQTVSPEIHSAIPLQTVVDEERVYAEIAKELETGVADKGLWTRLFAECGGDDKQTKVLYIKQRAERILAAEHLRFERVAVEVRQHKPTVSSAQHKRRYDATGVTSTITAALVVLWVVVLAGMMGWAIFS